MLHIFSFFVFFISLFSIAQAKIHFLHIPKCAGSTTHEYFIKNFPRHKLYPYRMITKQNMPLITQQYTSGHFPLWFLLQNDRDYEKAFIFTVLREPVERAFSNYRFWRKTDFPNLTYDEVPKNLMCQMLASKPDLQGEELLMSAIEGLHRMNAIIFVDNFENGLRKLFKLLNFRLPKKIKHFNITEPATYDESIIDFMKKENYLDILLYEYACKTFREPLEKPE